MQTSTPAHQVILNLPGPLYQRVRRTAETLRRSVEEVLLDSVATALPPLTGLPDEVSDELVSLAFLNDKALWEAARSCCQQSTITEWMICWPRKARIVSLRRNSRCSTELVNEYEVLVLRRSQAAVLLQRRGYDMSDPSILSRLP